MPGNIAGLGASMDQRKTALFAGSGAGWISGKTAFLAASRARHRSLTPYLQFLGNEVAVFGDTDDGGQVGRLFVVGEEIEPGIAIGVGEDVGAPPEGRTLVGSGGPLRVFFVVIGDGKIGLVHVSSRIKDR